MSTYFQASRNPPGSGDNTISSAAYSGHLRVIGQQLQQNRIAAFNLECTGSAYVVWTRDRGGAAPARSFFNPGPEKLERWWGRRYGVRGRYSPESIGPERRLEFSPEKLGRLEQRARLDREPTGGSIDGHSLSQLLRTIGSLVGQRNHRLLGISWRDLSVCVVVEIGQRRREIDVFRPDNLYDIWVRMYLRRQNRALSDVPH